jgi:hypothetical protein
MEAAKAQNWAVESQEKRKEKFEKDILMYTYKGGSFEERSRKTWN